MNIYRIKCSKFTNSNNNIKVNRKIDLYCYCSDCGFKSLNLLIKKNYSFVPNCRGGGLE